MASFTPTSPETLEDQRLYTQARLTEVACLDCLAKVGVKKNSEHHTSIQWTAESLEACAEFRRMSSQPGGRHVYETCPRLRASIERAVSEGKIEIGALDGY
jgi:post-segregation antitoxin (ccd killing protein)